MSARAFHVRDAEVAVGATVALHGVDFDLRTDEFVALLGANGSGKTTLVRALLGLLPLRSGRLEVFGVPISKFKAWHRIGYVPQRFTAASGVPATVAEVVLSGRVARARPLRPYSGADRAAAEAALAAVGLGDAAARCVSELSGGQQQRVLIARALAVEPDVLVLDEPVSAVDVDTQEAFVSTLEELRAAGVAVLLVAHALGPLHALVTRAVVLTGGRVSYDGPPLPVHDGDAHVHPHPERHHAPASGSQ